MKIENLWLRMYSNWDCTLVSHDREKKTIGEKEKWLKLRIDLKSNKI